MLTTQQVASELNLSRSRVQQLVESEELFPTETVTADSGRVVAYLFSASEVERFKSVRRQELEAEMRQYM